MSGHSKWAQIKRQKAVTDKKRGSIFTKLGNAITLAARTGGGDPEMNFKLRLAIDRAKAVNFPKDNIDRAIKRGTGELGGAEIVEVVYEGYGPSGVAIFIETLTGNKNRTVADIRHILSLHGGKIGSANSVAWMFAKAGVIRIAREHKPQEWENIELELIDAGATDIQEEEEGITILCPPSLLDAIKKVLEAHTVPITSSDVEMNPTTTVEIADPAEHERIEKLISALETLEDVTAVSTNYVSA